jgi:hypothetical protein
VLNISAFVITLLAIAVRIYWVRKIQDPFDAVYSDMQGYFDRAQLLLDRSYGGEKKVLAFYPFGTHYVFAAEFALLGRTKNVWVPLVHAVYSGTFVYPFMHIARRFVSKRWMAIALGLIAAFWQPCIWFVGFFLSEVPFFPLFYWNMLFGIHFLERRKYGLWFGLTAGILFVIRPQAIMSTGLAILVYAWRHRRKVKPAFRRLVRFGVPFAAILAFSIGRHKVLTEKWGLISDNGSLNRVFSDTPIAKVEAHWTTPTGAQWAYWFQPPTKTVVGESEAISFEGYIGDAEILGRIRKERTSKMTTMQRITRALRNLSLLWDRNNPWPESGKLDTRFRWRIQQEFNHFLRWFVLPVAMLGLLLAKKRARWMLMFIQLFTLAVMSMMFFPEARYRAPYDPILLMFALVALERVVRFVWRRVRAKWTKRRAMA